ncbi:MAG: hypothetical protein WCR30_02085 [Clostridia bacterium]
MKKNKLIKLFTSFFLILIVAVIVCVAKNNEVITVEKLDSMFDGLDNFELSTPFVFEEIDEYSIRSFSTPENVGIDFFCKNGCGFLTFRAMYNGIITHVEPKLILDQGETDNWAFEIWIMLNSKYSILLEFETWGYSSEVKTQQENNLFVKVGDYITQGTIIGNLVACQDSAHVHFSLKEQNVPDEASLIAPESFFSKEALRYLDIINLNQIIF